MASPVETLAAWAAAALKAAAPTALVLRGGAIPVEIPAGGLINVVDPAPEEVAELLGGAREWAMDLEIELAVAGADDAARAAALDALAQSCAVAILAASPPAMLDHRRAHPLRDRQDLAQPGAQGLKTATLPVELHFTTSTNPMETPT